MRNASFSAGDFIRRICRRLAPRAWLDPRGRRAPRFDISTTSNPPEETMHQARRTLPAACDCCAPALTRRNLLAGGAATLAAGAFVASGIDATAQAKPHRIDVHHHVTPPSWLDALKKAKLANAPRDSWSVQKSLDDMDKAG